MTKWASRVITVSLLVLSSCSSAPKDAARQQDVDALRSQVGEVRNQMTSLGAHLDSLESKLTAMNDKIESTRVSVDNFMNVQKPRTMSAGARPSDDAGLDVDQPKAKNDPESGFETDEPIAVFRRAMILYEARKYPDSVLAFSNFVEKYPDHPLAGTAQYYVGESYFREKEFKLALQEFERVLTTYDRSAHVSDTLSRMAEIEDHLKLPDAAARHRHLLTSLFPQSPAAGDLRLAQRDETGAKPNTPAASDTAKPSTSSQMTPTAASVRSSISPGPLGKTPGQLDEPPPTAPMQPAPTASGSSGSGIKKVE